MRHYSKELYSKFKTNITNIIDSDSFHDYFMNAVESGVRTYSQKNQKIIKTIDEKWINALHDTIPALDEIINKPRKFIVREEVIVPIELARKVGADSVKHLATHTQYISRVDEKGNVIPNKIMNTYNEESFNLYENRFIMSLIKRATDFVDARYDAVMALTGDEFQSDLKVNSSFSDNDEKVEYKMLFKVHQGPDYLGSEHSNAAILEKLKHIRLMFTSFKRTEFYQALINCTLVKSPISRTNLIMKNPKFKQCYDLWCFLERYTETGYSIEQHNSLSEFRTDYVEELNSMILFNYLIVKNNLEDENNRAAIVDSRKDVIKPKFQRKLVGDAAEKKDLDKAKLRRIPEEKMLRGVPASKAHEDAILAVLTNFLREEQIITQLENALAAETEPQKTKAEPAPVVSIPEPVAPKAHEPEEIARFDDEFDEQLKGGIQEILAMLLEKERK